MTFVMEVLELNRSLRDVEKRLKVLEDSVNARQRVDKSAAELNELLKEPWIIREEGSGTQMAVEKALRKKDKSLKQFNVVMEMGSTSSMKEGVKAKLGLAFISKRAVEEELNQGLLSPIGVEGMEPIHRLCYIITHRGRTLSPIGMEFLRFLKGKKEKVN